MGNFCLRFFGCFIGGMMLSGIIHAQCTFGVDVDIEDLQTIDLQISVENLVNADLAGSQQVCAVELRFRHSYVGDLTIELISPAGQVVQLVGPVTDQINPTNLTTWDIRFLQCGFPASPDPGFTAQWNNNQAWQVFTTYTGSYYPATGCLEDFNMGSANGFWHLSITDHDALQTGVLLGVTLIFCDDTGLECSVCGADAGSFGQSTLSICEGSEVILSPEYADTIPDPQLYGFQFLFSEDNVNVAFVEEINTAVLVPGNYSICSISYSIADSTELFSQIDTMTFDEIQIAFLNDDLLHCASITENCVSLTVDASKDTTFRVEEICSGSAITIDGHSYFAAGTYVIPIDVPGACDSVVILDLDVILVDARVVQEDTVTCEDVMTTLDGSISVAGASATFAWSTINGTILSLVDQPVITIHGSGTYDLVVTYQGCADTLSYTVVGDASIPFIAVDGGSIDCNSPTFTFNTVVFPVNVIPEWSGPNGFVSDSLNPTVANPGSYHLFVTDPDGCASTVVVEIVLDTDTVPTSISTIIDCANDRTFLSGNPGNLEYQYNWTGPNGFTNPTRQFWTSEQGTYCATLTPPNGCLSTTCIDILADYAIPDILVVVSSDTVHCGGTINLSVSSVVPGVSIAWSGPAGFFSSASDVEVFEAGTYIATVSSPNGCTNVDTAIIFPGQDVFDAFTFTDTINCDTDTALIGAVTFEPGAQYIWSGPGLIDSFSAFVRVTQPGIYQVVIAVGQCERIHTIRVTEDFSLVNFRGFPDTITCLEPIAELTILISSPYEEIHWEFPDGSESSDSILHTSQTGIHLLSISGANGCIGMRQVVVSIDTLPPTLFFESELLGCDSTQIQTFAVDSLVAFGWIGQNGFTSDELSPFVYEGGDYIFTASGANGCVATKIHTVDTNRVRPIFTIDAEELDCIDSIAVLTIESTDTANLYLWYLEGVLISDSANIEVSQPGSYVVVGLGPNGCTAVDSTDILSPTMPQIFVQTDTVTCASGAMLSATSDLPGTTFTWVDVAGMSGNGTQFSTVHAGQVTIMATGINGCIQDTTIMVEADTLAPVAIALSNEQIRCDFQSIHLDASGSVGQALAYIWNSVNGIIESGMNTATPLVTGEGVYVVLVTDGSNGCTDSDTLYVNDNAGTLGTIYLTVISECEGNGNGSISIDSVVGGTTTLIYAINGVAGGPFFDHISSGEYHIVVVDSFGCTADTTLEISNTSSTSTVNLGDDKDILIGDTVILETLVDLDPSEIMNVEWDQPVQCDSCLINVVSPLQTVTYTVSVTDAYGCIATDAATIFVAERPRFYVPNIFSPNGDSVNDYLTISAHPGIERILVFSIYDRWGNVVFQAKDFDASDGYVLWDGTFDGKSLNPAVFVYLLTVKLLSGRVETNHGTITIVK